MGGGGGEWRPWEMLARKRVLAVLASSAIWRAFSRCSRAWRSSEMSSTMPTTRGSLSAGQIFQPRSRTHFSAPVAAWTTRNSHEWVSLSREPLAHSCRRARSSVWMRSNQSCGRWRSCSGGWPHMAAKGALA
jgi:hypothetical protein